MDQVWLLHTFFALVPTQNLLLCSIRTDAETLCLRTQKGILVVLGAGVASWLTIRWWMKGKEAQKPELATAASGDPITGTQKG